MACINNTGVPVTDNVVQIHPVGRLEATKRRHVAVTDSVFGGAAA